MRRFLAIASAVVTAMALAGLFSDGARAATFEGSATVGVSNAEATFTGTVPFGPVITDPSTQCPEPQLDPFNVVCENAEFVVENTGNVTICIESLPTLIGTIEDVDFAVFDATTGTRVFVTIAATFANPECVTLLCLPAGVYQLAIVTFDELAPAPISGRITFQAADCGANGGGPGGETGITETSDKYTGGGQVGETSLTTSSSSEWQFSVNVHGNPAGGAPKVGKVGWSRQGNDCRLTRGIVTAATFFPGSNRVVLEGEGQIAGQPVTFTVDTADQNEPNQGQDDWQITFDGPGAACSGGTQVNEGNTQYHHTSA